MNQDQLPTLSYIIPTRNAAALIGNCLRSVRRQAYPADRCQILLADAHSTDATRQIGREHGAVILDDDGRNMEEGKRLALAHAQGQFIVFLDADNELTHPDYIELAVRGLLAHPQALGVESYYLPSPRMTSFCAYLTCLLHISDPLCWIMSVHPILLGTAGDIERWTLPGDSLAYPLGANGFVFRRADLESVKAGDHFQDTHVALRLMQSGRREWLRVRGRGVHHYYVQTLTGFIQKRRRAAAHFANVRQEVSISWIRQKPAVPPWLAVLYCVSLVGPLYHTLRSLLTTRDPRWLWHLPACLASVLGAAWGLQTQLFHARENKLIARLQPDQRLKE